ncbi:MMPL family transporter [Acetobacterium paludosum]|uniref:MMPL family transporter n=1 Tax=Acetobacterium paludosum TaxID=52693 RepID=A0A923HSF6_9FIRM|nr:MMPL family transporter [Acetobacterium paludosum]MBC3887491.1 MMPL family transporter [Acetobacterium paludosum]
MERFTESIVKHKKGIVLIALILTLISALCFFQVGINYNMTDYLPADANSTIALNTLKNEFGEAIPNCNVLMENVSIEEGMTLKSQIEGIDGVEKVNWLDDVVDIHVPLETQDQAMVDDYYKDGDVLFSVAIADGKEQAVTDQIQSLLGDKVMMSGPAVEQADAQRMASSQSIKAICLLGPLIILILILATTSWIEPFIYLTVMGAAVLLNLGTEIFRGEISYVTLAVVPILQMAVSLDYAVILSTSFAARRKTEENDTKAMKLAMKDSTATIVASAFTAIFGFMALIAMNFKIGPDMGISLVKGVTLSLVFCLTFLPAMILLLNKWIDKTRHKSFLPSFKKVGKLAVKRHIPIFLIIAIVSFFCYMGQSENQFIYGSGDTSGHSIATQTIDEKFGVDNVLVLLVPKGDSTKEMLLADDIKKMDYVSKVTSYTTEIGNKIPETVVPDIVTDNFYSDNYARMFIYSDLPDESSESFDLVKNIREDAATYYGDKTLSCGQSANLYDMKNTVESDNKVVSVLTILSIFIILAVMFRSWLIPILLILTIKCAIWINMAVPYFTGSSLIYIGFLVVSALQMGATIDYAILLTDHYMKNRKQMSAKKAMEKSVTDVIPAILVSAAILAFAGFSLALVSTNAMVSALGVLIGRGALIPLVLVSLFLPALLLISDKLIPLTTWKSDFYQSGEKDNRQDGQLKKKEKKERIPVLSGETMLVNIGDDVDDSVSWITGGNNNE